MNTRERHEKNTKKPIDTSSFSEISVAILAGGFGKRLQPVVKDKPKVLATIRGHPFLEYILHQLDRSGFKRVVLCTGYLSQAIKKAFGGRYKNLHLVYSQEQSALGTAGSLRNALPLLNSETILVLNGDSFCTINFKNFWEFHVRKKSHASLALVSIFSTNRFGRVKLGVDNSITQFQEKEDRLGTEFINAGVYLIKKNLIEEIPEKKQVSIEKEVFPSWIGRGFYGYKTTMHFIDIGTPETYRFADQFFANYTF